MRHAYGRVRLPARDVHHVGRAQWTDDGHAVKRRSHSLALRGSEVNATSIRHPRDVSIDVAKFFPYFIDGPVDHDGDGDTRHVTRLSGD
jgi:hypothetical protein